MKSYIQKTIQVYDALGAKYLSNIDNATPEEIHLFIKDLPSQGKVLDVGCAGGRDSKVFSDEGFQVTGIDLCEEFLVRARARVPGAVFLQEDLLDLTFSEESFHGIWACAVLLHLEKADLPKVLGDFFRILKPGGSLFIGVKEGEGERSVIDSLSDGKSRYFSFYREDEIASIVEAAGFKITSSQIKEDLTGRNEVKWIRMIAKKAQ